MKELEFLRGIAILAVIAIHTTGGFATMPLSMLSFSLLSINTISHFAVPLFLFISGFSLSIKYFDKIDLKEFYKKRFFRIVPAYILFMILYIYYFEGIGSILNTTTITRLYSFSYPFHFWFFRVLIEFYLFYPILTLIYQRLGTIVVPISVLFSIINVVYPANFDLIAYLPCVYLGLYLNREDPDIDLRYILPLCIVLAVALIYVEFYKYYDVIKISTTLLYYSDMITWGLFNLSAIILLFAVSFKIKNAYAMVLSELGRASFGIYLVHVYWIDMLYKSLGI